MECQECGDEAEELVKIKVGKRTLKVCDDCAAELQEDADHDADLADEAEGAMAGMMEYKGRR